MKKFGLNSPSGHSYAVLKKGLIVMKITLLLILVSTFNILATNAYSQTARVSLNLNQTSLKQALKEIERSSEFYFLYNNELIDVERKVDILADNEQINTILDRLFADQEIKYVVYDRQIVISPANMPLPQDAQRKVSGKVSDSSGGALPGVTVVVKGTTNGTITDANGNYTIFKVPENSSLQFSFVGMKSQEISVGGKTSINVTLVDETVGIEEVVAVGYGVQRKSDLTGATNRLSEKDMIKTLASSPVEMIQGRVAGVNITQNSGEPGAGMTVRIRGASSIRSGQEPLYVVDGIPLDNSNLTPAGGTAAGYGSGGSKNPLGFINPEDIESIDILKDASSTAIYGARGANGVVLVTTKKGKKGESTITFDSYLGVSTIRTKMDMLTADAFRAYTRADGAKLLDKGASTDWQNEIFRSALTQNHALGLSGGSDKSSYHLSLGYLDQQGIILNSGMKKLNGSIKLTQKAFNDKLLLTASLMASQQADARMPITEASGSGYEGDLIITALKSNPTFPIYNADGTYFQYTTAQRNPVAMMNLVDDRTNTLRVVANMSAEYEIIKGLKYKLNIGLDKATAERRVNQDNQLSYLPNHGQANINSLSATNKLIENYVTYATKFGDAHSFNFLLGHSYQNFSGTSNNLFVYGFTVQGVKYTDNLGYGNFSSSVSSSSAYEREIQSFFGRVNYSLKDRYLLTFTMRRDGSSKFGANNKYGNFPSAALAWRVLEEDFMKSVNLFSNLKVRLGWGLTGNQEIPDKISLMSVGTATNANLLSNGVLIPGITFNRTPNPDIKWETTNQVNFGIDFGFLKDRLSGTIDLFNKKTTDVLLEIASKDPAPTSTQWQNVPGLVIKNNGIEIGLTGVMINKPGVKWDATFNIASINNKVSGLVTPIQTGAASGQGLSGTFTQEIANDQPIGSFYGMVFEGFDSKGLGIYKKDASGAVVKEFLGSALPDVTYSLSSSLKFKSFDASMFWYGTRGNKVYNNTANALFLRGPLENSGNVRADIATNAESPSNSNAFSSRFIEDGSFLRLANLTLGYTFNTKSIKWLSKFRVYATGNNLLLVTKYKGFDPEVNINASNNNVPSLGVDYSTFPKSRTFTFGVSLQF